MTAPSRKAIGDVIIRHTCNGKLLREDYIDRRMVFVNRRGQYYIKIYTRDWPVTRIGSTAQFVCEFAGRTRT